MNTTTEPDAATMAVYLANAAAIVERSVVELLRNAAARDAMGPRFAAVLGRRAAALSVQLDRWRDMERAAREREGTA